MRNWILLLGLLTAVLAACAPKGSYTNVSADDLYAQLGRPNVLIVDVRTPAEFAEGHIAGAVNYPLQTIERWYKDLPKDKPVYLYCRSGNRSQQAAEFLKKKGFGNIYNEEGGIIAWAQRNYPLVR
ncbi:MAG TPA: rhodanese-like domain-containing protein [Oceanithermus profundus]|uniref:Rhodanese-like domain-containing protein n=1 Tax=Oceanithermus profundus TaxID=187137 RepID=A0A7C4ZCC1_9DEIN|nr:rhodanese-like domain-containing protein [Oceanithermus profundus]